jgi:hypothetical protein
MAIEGAARPDGVAWTPVPVDDIQSQSNSGAGARSAAGNPGALKCYNII